MTSTDPYLDSLIQRRARYVERIDQLILEMPTASSRSDSLVSISASQIAIKDCENAIDRLDRLTMARGMRREGVDLSLIHI